MSPAELREVHALLQDFLVNKSYIRPFKSPYAALILFVRKKDGTMRIRRPPETQRPHEERPHSVTPDR
jgi:hypothetical protein